MSTVNEKNTDEKKYDKKQYDRLLKTGEFARLSRINRDTLSFYIKKKLISPFYVGKNKYKYFLPEQAQTIRLIRYMRDCRMPLDSIRQLLAEPAADNLHSQLARQKVYLEEQVRQLSEAVEFIDDCVRERDDLDAHPLNVPYIEECRVQKAFFCPFPFQPPGRTGADVEEMAEYMNEQSRRMNYLTVACLLHLDEENYEESIRAEQASCFPAPKSGSPGKPCELTVEEGTYVMIAGRFGDKRLDENIALLKEKADECGFMPDGQFIYLFAEDVLLEFPPAEKSRYRLKMKLKKKTD